MKHTKSRILAALLALLMVAALAASAGARAPGKQLTVGQYGRVTVAEIPANCTLADTMPNQFVPGMWFVVDGGTVILEGSPTTVGAYSGLTQLTIYDVYQTAMTVTASWAFDVIGSSPTPTPTPTPTPDVLAVTKNPTSETVTEGGSAIFVTYGTGYSYMNWYLVNENETQWINVNSANAYFPGLVVKNSDPTRLVLSNVPLGLNGYKVVTELTSAYNISVTTDRKCHIYVNRAGLSITKNPTSETVDEGGYAEFVTYGTGYSYMEWYLVSPENNWIPASTASSYFPGLGVQNPNGTRLILRNIPAALTGYKVITTLYDTTGKQMNTTNNCVLTVKAKVNPVPVREEVSIGVPADSAKAESIPDTMTSADGKYEIAFVTDMGQLKDKSFNQGTYNGVKLYADENNVSYKYYEPAGGNQATDEDIYAAMKAAAQNGAKVIVCAGTSHSTALPRAAAEFPNVKFVYIDGEGVGDRNNIAGITFKEEQSGFLAGYAAVKEGYRKLGFMGGGGGKYPAVCRFGYGFAQGANAAAAELGIKVSMKYSWMYGAAFSASEQLRNQADYWYNMGTEVIFVAGGSMFDSVAASASQHSNARIIGVDIDQSSQSGAVITSALKDLTTATKWAISKAYNGSWDEVGGKTTSIGAAVGATGLPTDTWSLRNFSVSDYNSLLQSIASGRVFISNLVLENFAIANERFSNLNVEYIA